MSGWEKLRSEWSHGSLRPIALLLSGTAAAQFIPLLSMPVLTRLYSPADYGALALATSIVTVVFLIATGTLDLAINLPREAEEAENLFLIVLGSATLCATLLALSGLTERLVFGHTGHRLWYVPVALWLTVAFQTSSAWLNRVAAFRHLARARLVLALATTLGSLGFGWWLGGELGLFLGQLTGLVCGTAVALSAAEFWALRKRRTLDWVAIKATVHTHRNQPLWQLPSALVNTVANQIPLWFLQRLFGPSVLGQYVLMNRVLSAPTSLISASVGEVFRQRAATEWHETGACLKTFNQFARGLGLVCVPVGLALIAFGPAAFELIFGIQWRQAGEFARLLGALFILHWAVNPLTYVLILSGRQKLNFGLQFLLLGVALAGWGAGALSHSPAVALGVFGSGFALFYLVNFVACRRLAGPAAGR